MCTLTIGRRSDWLLVTVNRDETRLREAASAPEIFGPHQHGSASWAAPIDGACGGTWIGANDRGVVACLLNLWEDGLPAEPQEAISRGKIIPRLLAAGRPGDCLAWLEERFDPRRFRPFRLIVVSDRGIQAATWRGRGSLSFRQTPRADWTLFTSSSWKPSEVAAWRRKRFERWLEEGCDFQGDLPSFHRIHSPCHREWGPLMKRNESVTRSITQVALSRRQGRVELRYWEDPWQARLDPSHRVFLRHREAGQP